MGSIEYELFDKIMSEKANGFLHIFEKEWEKQMTEFDPKFSFSFQMRSGHRLRPILVAWGYSIFKKEEEIIFEDIISIAVSVEMIHKASIIIDDLVDEDSSRHSLPAFHIEHSSYEAVLFVVQLLSGSFKILSEQTSTNENLKIINLLSNTISSMAQGVLKELQLDKEGLSNLKEINEIINFQTVGLIRNSLYLGFLSSIHITPILDKKMCEIGDYLGYVFQVLNDLEPFSTTEKNVSYKGNQNYDFNKSRKNIVIGYLLSLSNSNEKKNLVNEKDYDFIITLYKKYKVKDICLVEVENIKIKILKDIENLNFESKENQMWKISFSRFIEYVFQYCLSRI